MEMFTIMAMITISALVVIAAGLCVDEALFEVNKAKEEAKVCCFVRADRANREGRLYPIRRNGNGK